MVGFPMIEILAAQMMALVLAVVSIAAADSTAHSARIGHRLHALWVSFSIAAMCLPIVLWAATVFVGDGTLRCSVAGLFEAALFLCLYRNLRSLPPARKLGYRLPPPPPVERAAPPAGR